MDYKKAVDEKKKEMSELQTRLDDDADLINLESYTLKDADDHKLPHSISVTLPDIGTFVTNVEAALGNAIESVAVETEDKKLDTSYIEDVIRAGNLAADRRRQNRGEWPVNPVLDQFMCRRGGGAARELVYFDEKGNLIIDITPWDRRYTYYAMGIDGLDWAAYETKRSKDMILAEYPDANVTGASAIVLDIWGKDVNEIYIAGKKYDERPNNYGFVPVCVQMVPMGSMLVEKEKMLAKQGESLLFLVRDLIPELNRLVSIMQSMNLKELDRALQEKTEDTTGKAPDHEDITRPGSVTKTKGSFDLMPLGQLRSSALWLNSIFETRMQRASLNNFDYGTFTQQMSAVALIEVGEGRNVVFLPRLGARGLLNEQLAFMLIDELLTLGVNSVDIGARGHKRTFDLRKLQGEYDIQFKYFIKSPAIDMARIEAAAAAASSGLYSMHTARRDIAQQEKPDEEERRLSYEEIEQLVPAIKLRRNIADLYKMAEEGDEEARLDAQLAEEVLMQLIGQAGQPQQAPRRNGKMAELFAKEAAGGQSSAQRASQLQRTPAEEE